MAPMIPIAGSHDLPEKLGNHLEVSNPEHILSSEERYNWSSSLSVYSSNTNTLHCGFLSSSSVANATIAALLIRLSLKIVA